jgi:hypothetical protein
MNERTDPADAARALSEIDRRREQVIRRKVFPGWWWWAYAVLITAFSAAVESGHGVLLWIAIALFVLGTLLIDVPVRRAARAAAPRRGLGARRTLIGLASFVVGLLAVAVGTAFSLKAAGIPDPGTIAAAITGVLFAVVGPMLVRYEADLLVHRSGSQG